MDQIKKSKPRLLAITPFLWTHQEGAGVPTVYQTLLRLQDDFDVHILIPSKNPGPTEYKGMSIHSFPLRGWGEKQDYGLFKSLFLYPMPASRVRSYFLGKFLWLQTSTSLWWEGRKLAKSWKRNHSISIFYCVTSYAAIAGFLLRWEFGGLSVTRLLGTFLTPYLELKTPWQKIFWAMPRFNEFLAFLIPADQLVITNDGTQGDKVVKALEVKTPLAFWRNGLDLPETTPEEKQEIKKSTRAQLLEKYQIAESSLLGVYAGQLIPWKRVDRIVDAVKLLPNDVRAQCKFLIAGSGPEEARLKALAEKNQVHDCIVFTGSMPQSEIWKIYAASDFFICPHDLSCAANSTFEAMAFGLPIVCTCYGDTSDFIKDREQGLHIDGKKNETLAGSIAKLVQDPSLRKDLGEGAYTSVKKEFQNWQKRIHKESSLLLSLLQQKAKQKNILILSQYFFPENFKINDLTSELKKRGYFVEILTGLPNYPKGKFFEGYSYQGPYTEIYDSCRMVRVPLIPRRDGSRISLVLNYFSFVFFASLLGIPRLSRRPDATIVFATSPLLAAIPGIFLRRLRSTPLLIWVQDLWPESISAVGAIRNPRILRAIGKLVRWIYQNSDFLLIQSKAFQKNMNHFEVPPEKVIYLPNWAEDFYCSENLKNNRFPLSSAQKMPEGFRVLYAGNLGKAQNLDILLSAAQKLQNQRELATQASSQILSTAKPLQIIFLGEGSYKQSLLNSVQSKQINNVTFLEGESPEKMPLYFSMVDMLFISLNDSEILHLTIPSKVQTCLASGRPILASLSGEGAKILNESQAALVSPAMDVEALTQNLAAALSFSSEKLEQMGQSGRTYYDLHFAKESVLNTLDRCLRSF